MLHFNLNGGKKKKICAGKKSCNALCKVPAFECLAQPYKATSCFADDLVSKKIPITLDK